MSRVTCLLFCAVLPACSPAPVRTAPQPRTDGGAVEVTAPNGIPVSLLPGASGNPAVPAAGALQIVADSLADTEVLDSIHDAAALDSVPELELDVPSWDLSVEKFAAHPRVQYYVDFFAGRSRERFQVWLDRMPRFEGYAREQLAAHDLPGDLVYLALIESGFSTVATSRASAVGMWQFMAPTGRAYGLRVDGWVDERRDPIKATDAAARHLADLTERFGSHYLAAAAYNGGAGRVGRGLTRMASGDDDFDQSSDDAFFELASTSLIYQETKDYVPKLIAAALIAKEPTKYQFREPADVAPFPRDSVIVDGGTGLDLIARLAGTTLDAMRELNPHLLRMVTPPGRTYAVRLPEGRAVMVAQRYADVPARDRTAVATHRVAKGETVTTIARRYGVPTTAIRSANSNARSKRLATGSTLYIPVSNALPESALREPELVTNTRSRTHLVRRGETLSGIASRYNVSQASIRTANKLPKSGAIRLGQKLVVKGATGTASKSAVAARTTNRTHVVKAGETVGSIAQRYGVRQSTLISVNGLGRRAVIRKGQRLRIPV
ncbi:MAG: LysM peptidoglycan-binding domain-containing protein [Gemmatimonadales bacterium]|nr:LysM peptidoglycan-binding domain-containing protein [Gemmatimonadales bacterium]